jgi:hypothetical protein
MKKSKANESPSIHIKKLKNLYLDGDKPAIPDNIYIDELENLYINNPKPDVDSNREPFPRHTLTNSQLSLAAHFIFKSLSFYARVNVDIASIARVIHFFADKPYTNIHNSDFYKKLKKAPNFKADRELIKDLEVVRIALLKMGFKEAALLVEKEILLASQEVSHNSNY